jgi:hypothetical protein
MKHSILLIFFYISTSLFAATDSSTVRFAAIGDYGSGSQNEADVASLLDSWNVEFVITAGDNRYGNTTFDQVVGQFYCDFLKDAGSGSYCAGGTSTTNAFFPSLGNHDYNDGGGVNEYLSYFSLPGNERYYDFVWGPVHFFAINSDSHEPDGTSSSSIQARWLQNQLAASTTPWQIVYFHHAAYSSGKHGSTAYMQWPFAAWGADAVITGHDHTYERINRDGIVFFVNGLGGKSRYRCGSPVTGSQICYDDDYGAMLIEANESDISFQFINRAGGVIDTYNIDHTDDSIDVRIIQSADDVEQRLSDGTMYLDSSDLELGNDLTYWGEQSIGLRFQNVTIPQGATITAAYIEFETDETDSEPTSVRFHGEAADNAAPFGTGAYALTNRPLTAAVVDWNDIPAWNTVNEKHRSPDLSAIVQEIMDRPGWSANNSIVFVISGTGRRVAEAYDGEAAPLLHVEYSTDRDGDGLSDSYETENGLDPDNPHDAVADPDSDGLVNLQEAAMGTDPQVADTDGDAVDDWHDPAPLDDSINGIRLYEDAEDGLIDGWSVTDNKPNQPQIPTISNVSGNAGQVIQLSGNGTKNAYKLEFGGSNTTQFVAQWDMNFAEPYQVMWNIDTDTGAYKQVKFTKSRLGCTAINTTVKCGLGINSVDGNWHTMMADLNAVVQRLAQNFLLTFDHSYPFWGINLVIKKMSLTFFFRTL